MKRSKLFLASTAGLLSIVGITSAKMHKFFSPKKQCYFLHNPPGLYTIPVMMYTVGNRNFPSVAYTEYNRGPMGNPCFSQPYDRD